MPYPENVTLERRHWISEMANDTWVSTLPSEIRPGSPEFSQRSAAIQERIEEFVTASCSPEELHYFAEHWNWDKGIDALRKIVRNPSCDFSTVQLLFWRACPDAYQIYACRDDIERKRDFEMWDFIHEILERVESNTYDEGNFPYNPTEDMYVPEPGQGEWEIPEVLRQPTT